MPQPSSLEPTPIRFAWRDAPAPDAARELVLYKYDSCPFCRRVTPSLHKLERTTATVVPQRDVLVDAEARAELLRRTGRSTVPCLFIDGVALFESAEIIQWLDAHTAWHQRQTPR